MAKKHFLFMLCFLLAFVTITFVAPLVLVVVIDPLNMIRKHDADNKYFIDNEELRVAGLITQHLVHHEDRRHIVIGSSLIMNTEIADLKRYAHMDKGLLLGISGMRSGEFALLYSQVIDKPCVDTIIVGFDAHIFFAERALPGNRLPRPLYAGNRLDTIKSMLRLDVMGMAIRILRGVEPEKNADSMYSFMAAACGKKAFSGNAANFASMAAEAHARAETVLWPVRADTRVGGLELALPLLTSTPEHITVHVIIPPVFFNGKVTADFPAYYSGLLRLVRETGGRGNIVIYGFDDVPAITNNVANYYDHAHYGIGVNRYMLKAIAGGKHRLTPGNVEGYLRRVWENRKYGKARYDPEHTASFEGPVDEALFSGFPDYPDGPAPLALPNEQADIP